MIVPAIMTAMFIGKIALGGLACAVSLIVFAPPSRAAGNKVEHGRYLVEEVAKCGDCHTPVQNGEYDRSNWMKGGALSFAPTKPIPNWHKTAPDITSAGALFERWGEKGLVTFLTTGKGPRGNAAGPPMPPYKLKRDDAEAIVEYLKTLK